MKTKIIFFLATTFLLNFSLLSQNFWRSFSISDGLIDSVVTDLAMSNNNVYISTPQGLSIFDGSNFVNYDTSNSNMASQNIKIIRAHNNMVSFVTDSGITEFDGSNFINYDTTNGLLTNEIRDIEYDSKGNLWIASLRGLSKKQGSVFSDDTTRMIYDIGINSGDSIYANTNFNAIGNIPNRVSAELYFNSTWSTLQDTSLKVVLSGAKFVSLSNGRVGITSVNEKAFSVSNDFKLTKFDLPENQVVLSIISSMEIDPNGRSWFSFKKDALTGSVIGGLFTYQGTYHFSESNLPSKGVSVVKHYKNKTYLGTLNGFCFASDTISNYPETMGIEGGNFYVNNVNYGNLFTNKFNRLLTNNFDSFPSFEFPKGSGRYLSYGLNMWLGSVVSPTELYLNSAEYEARDYRSGTLNRNNVAIRPSMISIEKKDIDFHLQNFRNPGYVMPKSIKNWPANGNVEEREAEDQTEFIDVNQNNCYDPENGDYPYILGDRAIYMVICDGTGTTRGSFVSRFGMEAHILIYVFDQPGVVYLDNTVFVRMNVVNRSSKTYNNVKFGLRSDFDIGNGIDDAIGCDLSSNISYTYNTDNFDEGSSGIRAYDSILPSIGTKFINRKITGHISPEVGSYNSGRVRNHLIDMLWKDSTKISVGGDGFNKPITTPTNFLYPGRLDRPSEWSFLNPGPGFPPNNPIDARSLARIDLGTWQPNERKQIDFAVGVGYDSAKTVIGNYKEMIFNLDKAGRFQQGIDSITPRGVYSACVTGVAENNLEKDTPSLLVYPNPSINMVVNVLATENLESVVVYDLNGREVLRENWGNSKRVQELSLPEQLKNGLYLIKVKTINGALHTSQFILQK